MSDLAHCWLGLKAFKLSFFSSQASSACLSQVSLACFKLSQQLYDKNFFIYYTYQKDQLKKLST
jgi:hypothetical protein